MSVAKRSARKSSVRLRAFAKINLFLNVIGRRPDNYHELRTIFQAISLYDSIDLSIAPGRDFEVLLSSSRLEGTTLHTVIQTSRGYAH